MKIKTLDMSVADGYVVTEFDIIKKALGKQYREDLLYRGFNGENIPKLLETGQDNQGEEIFCATEDEINDPNPSDETANIFEHATEHKVPAIAVFNPKKFITQYQYSYEFVDPRNKLETLVAVYKLKY